MSGNLETSPGIFLRRPDPQGGRGLPIDVPRLSRELMRPQDFGGVIARFDAGDTIVRDVSLLTTRERSAVLNIGDQGAQSMPRSTWEAFKKAAGNLQYGMENPHVLQGFAGWNFFVNAQGFINAGYPWALGLDRAFQREYGRSIQSALDYLQRTPADRSDAHLIVAHVAGNPANIYDVGYYLAGRSLRSEQEQERLYRPQLDVAKAQARNTFVTLADASRLPAEHQRRTLAQIDRIRFSAFDHLLLGVTTFDNNSTADYHPGTLRVEAKFKGSPASARPQTATEARHNLRHEVFHAAAAQNDDQAGLRLNDRTGLEVDEALTEYLNQIAGDFPDTITYPDGRVRFTSAYTQEVTAMYALQQRDAGKFAALFNRYFGQYTPAVGPALAEYYNILNRIYSM